MKLGTSALCNYLISLIFSYKVHQRVLRGGIFCREWSVAARLAAYAFTESLLSLMHSNTLMTISLLIYQ